MNANLYIVAILERTEKRVKKLSYMIFVLLASRLPTFPQGEAPHKLQLWAHEVVFVINLSWLQVINQLRFRLGSSISSFFFVFCCNIYWPCDLSKYVCRHDIYIYIVYIYISTYINICVHIIITCKYKSTIIYPDISTISITPIAASRWAFCAAETAPELPRRSRRRNDLPPELHHAMGHSGGIYTDSKTPKRS